VNDLFIIKNKRLAYLSLVIEVLNEIINKSMIQSIDINVDEGTKKTYCIHDMCLIPYVIAK